MKTLFCLSLALAAILLPAQEVVPAEPPPSTPEQLDRLLGPVALYPDALLAILLPAATEPTDIVLAARYLAANGDNASVDEQSWSDSVKALAHYPAIMKWMDENLMWTRQLGEVFLVQSSDVMLAVQRLRARARASGALVDTPQQQVVLEGETICIVPAQPEVIYVPRYDPEIVYVERPGYYYDSYVVYGVGYPVGFWLAYDLDWGRRTIWYVDRNHWQHDWRGRRDWRRPVYPGRPGYISNPHQYVWKPVPGHPRPPRTQHQRPHPEVIRPIPFNDTPRRPQHEEPGNRPARLVSEAPANHPANLSPVPSTAPPAATGRRDNPDRGPRAGERPNHQDRRERDHVGNRPSSPSSATAPSSGPRPETSAYSESKPPQVEHHAEQPRPAAPATPPPPKPDDKDRVVEDPSRPKR